MTPLPIDRLLPEIIARLRECKALVLVAPPGAGKTTRVPPAILNAGLLSASHPNLVLLQPRRVAARAAAQRIAEENGWELGREVGYHIRFEKRITAQTRLRVLTEGILTRQLQDDPFLEGIGAVLLDEFHERSLHTDLAAALLQEVRQTVRQDLILVVMSATLDAEPVSKFLGNCPIVHADGRTFPVQITYATPSAPTISDRMAAAVSDLVLDQSIDDGDVLAFLPGADEIRRTMGRLGSLAERENLLLLPLHGSLPAEEQMRALRPAKQRKIILATNIAETSLTIDGVTTVIDSGMARVAGYDPESGLDRLELKRISKASATQRAGRAGRTAPGRCIRLWSGKEQHALADFELPEVKRVDLCGTVLALHAWGKPDPRAFGWYEPPTEETLVSAERLLAMLGALDAESNGAITTLGKRMLALPVHPRLGRLLIDAADAGLVEQGAAIAALLSEKDFVPYIGDVPFNARRPSVQSASDLLIRLDLLSEAERGNFSPSLRDRGIDAISARQVAKTRDELLRIADRLQRDKVLSLDSASSTEQSLLKLTLVAYPDRVCRRRESDTAAGVMAGGGGVRLAPESTVRRGEFFLALDARADPRSPKAEAQVRLASSVEIQWLEELFPNSIRRERALVFDEKRQRVIGRGRMWYRDLLLRQDADAPVDANEAGPLLAEALRPRAAAIFASDEPSARFLARVAFVRENMPEHPWPALDDAQLGDALATACSGKRSVDESIRASLSEILRGLLPYPLDRMLDEQAPETVAVPSGSRIQVQYAQGKPPMLAVRLQELFGWTDTPRLAGGRVPVLLHLLAPNFRPVQITDDLRSFFTNTYFQVRKDLRRRYPKHSWPEDPFSAKAEARGKPRR